MKSDLELRNDVQEELKWEPGVKPATIGVAVKDGVVILNGYVDSYAEKWAAERTAPGELSRGQSPFHQCRRPVQAGAADRTPPRPVRPGLRQPVHYRQANHFQLSWLPLADSQARLPPHQPPKPTRPRLQGTWQY
jgi:hypothetical protein